MPRDGVARWYRHCLNPHYSYFEHFVKNGHPALGRKSSSCPNTTRCLSIQELRKVACEDWSERCRGKRVKAPKDRQDFEFAEKSAKDIEMEELMASLQSMGGMGGMGE